MQPFHGLTAAPFTPFHSDGTLNPDLIPAYARLLKYNGVQAAFICGTTGEGASLSTEERLQVAEAWMKAGKRSPRVIVHVGHTSQADAVRLAAHAREIGAAAISSMAPYFFKPATMQDLAGWCAAVAAAADPLPFYYYHIPSFTGVLFSMAQFLAEAEPCIPTLAGIKFTYEDLADYQKCLTVSGSRFDVPFGRDELLLESLKIGARGAIGSTYNYAAPLYLRMIDAYRHGNRAEARRLQDIAVRMIAICNSAGATHLAASKTIMAMLGVDCGPVRAPLFQPGKDQISWIKGELKAGGFLDFLSKPLA